VTALRKPELAAAERWALRLEIEEFHVAYAHTLDSGDLEHWPDYFTDDALYRITGRDNADYGLPIGLIYCDGKKMMNDRVRGTLQTMTFEPRYLRHLISNVWVGEGGADGSVAARANYLVVQTLMEEKTEIFQAGRYEDVFVRRDGRLLLRERHCIYDSLTIPNALVYPI